MVLINTIYEDNSDSNQVSNSNLNFDTNTNTIQSGAGTVSNRDCRICYEPVVQFKKFCLCEGSIANVHEKCLVKWLTINESNICEICKYSYNLKVKRKIVWKRLLSVFFFISIIVILFLYIFIPLNNDNFSSIIGIVFVTVLSIILLRSESQNYIKKTIKIIEYKSIGSSKSIASNKSIGSSNSIECDENTLLV